MDNKTFPEQPVHTRTALILLFAFILISMLAVTGWASWVQPVWEWTGLKQQPNHAWTIATLADAYFGFLTFYVWVLYKERRLAKRIAWFAAIMGLGNIAMAVYMLKELRQLRSGEGLSPLVTRRHD